MFKWTDEDLTTLRYKCCLITDFRTHLHMHLSVNLSYNFQLFLYSKQDIHKSYSAFTYTYIAIVRPCEICLAMHSFKIHYTVHFICEHRKIPKYCKQIITKVYSILKISIYLAALGAEKERLFNSAYSTPNAARYQIIIWDAKRTQKCQIWKCMCTSTFHSYDQISFVRFLPPYSAPSAFQNSLTPSSALGFPAQTPTFLLLLDHTLKVIKRIVWQSIQTLLSIYKYAMWQE